MSEKIGYSGIATHYRQLIADGALAPGDSMPSMREVCDQFGVSITTANRAFRLLKAEGLTIAKPGVGTVVADRARVAVTGAARLERIGRTGKPYARKERSIEHEVWVRSCGDPDVADMFDIDLHDEVLIRKRVFVDDGIRTVVAFSIINLRALIDVPELTQPGPLPVFWQKLYTERTGRAITKSPERRTARMASDDELEWLGISTPAGAAVPVLVLVNVFHDERGPIEVWEDVYAPGMWQVDSE